MREFLTAHYYLLSIIFLILILAVTALYYSRKLRAKEIVLISVLSSIAVIARYAFYFLPQFKPMAAVIFASASVLGAVPGMLIGMLSSFLSNFLFGQGPWTPFQMAGFAMVGIAGSFFDTEKKIYACIGGFFAVVLLYGPIVNFSSMYFLTENAGFDSFLKVEMTGLFFDLVHGIATAVFLWLIWKAMRRKLLRLRDKYGLLKKRR